MASLYLPASALILGIIGLIWGADKFVAGSASFARSMGISSLVIGLTIVSVGTSAPEIIISINAALNSSSELAIGNALGSNLANIGLVLGITLLIAPIPVYRHLLKEESPVLLLITGLAGICLYNGVLGQLESLLLVLLVAPLLIVVVKYKKSHPDSVEPQNIVAYSASSATVQFILGLAVLLAGAEITVWGAKSIATFIGISELVIGLTVVAIGTSLPELAASVLSAVRGHHDIALGNIIGSNLFNIMLVMGAAGAIAPISLDDAVFARDYIAMASMTLLMVLLLARALRGNRNKATLSKTVGLILLSAYCLYYCVLWLSIGTGAS
ncbi:MAG: calcium/sodium antiporter [Porticoccaceae bacterium]|nr:calcium/sodium antiporter [Porticoccaceae bacterium]